MQTFKWDQWQREVIDYKGSITLRAGRQVGKSTTVGKRRAKQLLKHKNSISLIIAPAQRQSSQLFIKVMGWLEVENQKAILAAGGWKSDPKLTAKRNMEASRQFEYDHGIYNEMPTKTTIILKDNFKKPRGINNQGSICYSLPAGKTGTYLRTYALDFLDIDEAAYVPESVYTALKPMLAVSEKKRGLGWETFLSTPFGKGGFFYDSHHSEDYKKFHISSEDCPRISKEFLLKEKQRLSRAEYMQEWCGEFTDEWNQFFKTSLIKGCMDILDWEFKEDYQSSNRYYLGVDFAGYGGDENAFVICEMVGNQLRVVKCITTNKELIKNPTTDSIGRIQALDNEFKFRKIFVDDGGLGSPISDILQEKMGRKVMRLNNASKRIEVQGEEKKAGILKEDLYSNALTLMEYSRLHLINDMSLLKSLKTITTEYSSSRKLRIFGKYSHLTEAMVRACWCIKEKGLNLYKY